MTQQSIRRAIVLVSALGLGLAALAPNVSAQDHWVATWAASPLAPAPPPPRPSTPAPSTAAAPAPSGPPTINNQTVRMIVHTSIGGHRARVQLSNAFGTTALPVGSAHVALRDKQSAIVPASDRALTFSGKASISIPPGAEILSDPVDLEVPKPGDLVISLYIPGVAATPPFHATALHTTYISKPGDFTGAPAIADPAATSLSWYWISAVDVITPSNAGLIVAFGDSITDGATSTPDTDRSWPSALARRLAANKATADIAIVNEGIGGNRLLNDVTGVSALARFDRDVLSQPGVKWLIVLEGINDIGRSSGPAALPQDAVTAGDLMAAHKQIIERAHLHGIKVIGATLTPYGGAAYSSDQGEAMREAINQWIRTSGAYDAVVDFDAATHDPANPKQYRAGFNIRDHLHPNDDGYEAMAEAVDLSIFTRKSK